jgi:hypothetical protein
MFLAFEVLTLEESELNMKGSIYIHTSQIHGAVATVSDQALANKAAH